MTIEIKVPMLPESVADATVSTWYKQPGDTIARGENIVDLETDKVMLEVPSPSEGTLKEILKNSGDVVTAEEVLAIVEEGAVAKKEPAKEVNAQPKKSEPAPVQAAAPASEAPLSPSAKRTAAEKDIDASSISGTGKRGRVTKQDILNVAGRRPEKRVPMTRIRQRIAERLLEVSQSTAMLTTFNEVNMKAVMDLRKQYKEKFEKQHGVKLGFMSFFVKAIVETLKKLPAVNASIDGSDVVYHGYFDIGVAVSTDRGLVVPVLRDVDQMSMAEIELQIIEYATRARAGKLTLEDMQGGTFTITNGGVFGSMLSTPILNAPQSGILGMHNIVERAVVENGEIVVRPMMYLALSYDHRIVDGKESVTFLVNVKQMLEDPARMLLNI